MYNFSVGKKKKLVIKITVKNSDGEAEQTHKKDHLKSHSKQTDSKKEVAFPSPKTKNNTHTLLSGC